MTLNLLTDLLIPVMLFILGYRIVKLLKPNSHLMGKIALAFPLGGGSLAWTIFILSWIGVTYNSILLLESYLLLHLLISVISHMKIYKNQYSVLDTSSDQPADGSLISRYEMIGLAALFLIMLVYAGVFSILRGYSAWDAIAFWSIKGYGIALEGTVLAGASWGAHGLGHPLNFPLQISFFKLLSGDELMYSTLISPLLFVSMIVGIYSFWRDYRVSMWVSVLGVIAIFTIPELLMQSTISYANVTFTSYLVLGTLWSIRGIFRKSSFDQVLGGILLALACWTRVEGVVVVAGVFGALLIARGVTKSGKIRPLAFLPSLVMIGLWLIFYISASSGGDPGGAISSMMAQIKLGNFKLYNLRLIFGYLRRHIFKIEIWGLVAIVGVFLISTHWKKILPREFPEAFAGLLVTLFTGLAILFTFYTGGFRSIDFYAWLTRGAPRASLPTAVLFFTIAILVIGAYEKNGSLREIEHEGISNSPA